MAPNIEPSVAATILAAVDRYPNGATLPDIIAGFAERPSRRSAQRWVSLLVDAGVLRVAGTNKPHVYFAVTAPTRGASATAASAPGRIAVAKPADRAAGPTDVIVPVDPPASSVAKVADGRAVSAANPRARPTGSTGLAKPIDSPAGSVAKAGDDQTVSLAKPLDRPAGPTAVAKPADRPDGSPVAANPPVRAVHDEPAPSAAGSKRPLATSPGRVAKPPFPPSPRSVDPANAASADFASGAAASLATSADALASVAKVTTRSVEAAPAARAPSPLATPAAPDVTTAASGAVSAAPTVPTVSGSSDEPAMPAEPVAPTLATPPVTTRRAGMAAAGIMLVLVGFAVAWLSRPRPTPPAVPASRLAASQDIPRTSVPVAPAMTVAETPTPPPSPASAVPPLTSPATVVAPPAVPEPVVSGPAAAGLVAPPPTAPTSLAPSTVSTPVVPPATVPEPAPALPTTPAAADPADLLPMLPSMGTAAYLLDGQWVPLPRNATGLGEPDARSADIAAATSRSRSADRPSDELVFGGRSYVPVTSGRDVVIAYVGPTNALLAEGSSAAGSGSRDLIEVAPETAGRNGEPSAPLYATAYGELGFGPARVAGTIERVRLRLISSGHCTALLFRPTAPLAPGRYAILCGPNGYELVIE